MILIAQNKLRTNTLEEIGLGDKINFEEINYGSFWFKNGVGPLRENIFKRFWGSDLKLFLKEEKSTFNFSLGIDSSIQEFSADCYQLLDYPDWYIIGDGILAKKIEKYFLVRQQWQVLGYNGEDFYFNYRSTKPGLSCTD
jgi:hypothetical protein